MRFTSTPRGARLARRLVSHRPNDWGHPCTTLVNETLTLVTAELSANAVRHGHVPGRDFHVQLTLADGIFRIEVTDTRAEKLPPPTPPAPDCASASGRGLHLVATPTDDRGVIPHPTAPGKTVWAELRGAAGSHACATIVGRGDTPSPTPAKRSVRSSSASGRGTPTPW
ncbi:ATP-binding protein [Streptomyces sp. NPDC004542]|uniref:ATP-binding protein n=1 Tax=Streptomyces sp. NPDC004542 TaxID=3154281 RepID=UPI0033B95523